MTDDKIRIVEYELLHRAIPFDTYYECIFVIDGIDMFAMNRPSDGHWWLVNYHESDNKISTDIGPFIDSASAVVYAKLLDE